MFVENQTIFDSPTLIFGIDWNWRVLIHLIYQSFLTSDFGIKPCVIHFVQLFVVFIHLENNRLCLICNSIFFCSDKKACWEVFTFVSFGNKDQSNFNMTKLPLTPVVHDSKSSYTVITRRCIIYFLVRLFVENTNEVDMIPKFGICIRPLF